MGQFVQLIVPRQSRLDAVPHGRGSVREFPEKILRERDDRLLRRVRELISRHRTPLGMELEFLSDGTLPETWIEQELKFLVNARGIGIRYGFVSQRLDHGEDPDRYHAYLSLMPVEEPYRPHVPDPEQIALISNGKRLRIFQLLPLRP